MPNLAAFGLLRFLSSSLDFELAQLVAAESNEGMSASGSEWKGRCLDFDESIQQLEPGARSTALQLSRGFNDAH